MHVDLAGLDTREEIPAEPGQDEDHRDERRRQENDDKPTALLDYSREQCPVAVTKLIEALLELHLEATKCSFRSGSLFARLCLPAQQQDRHGWYQGPRQDEGGDHRENDGFGERQ